MEDDRLLSCAFCAGMLPCLADRHPILEAACKHFRLREHLGECVIIVDGREHGISHPAEMHRLEAASGHSNRTYICKMYFVRIGLLLDRLDDVQSRSDVCVQSLLRIRIRCRRYHCTDVQHVIRSINAFLDGIIINHITPDDLQCRAAILLEKLFVLCRRTCQNPGDKTIAPGEQLLHGLLPHCAGRACHKDDLFRTKRICVFLRIVKLQRRVKAFPGRIECTARTCCITDLEISDSVLIAGSCQGTAISLPGSDCHNCIVARIAYFRAILLTNYFPVADFLHSHAGHRNDACGINTLIHTDLSRCTEIRADLGKHLEDSYGCAFFCQVLSCLHAYHTAADHNGLAGYSCFSVQNVMRVDNESFVMTGNRNYDRFRTDGIDQCVRLHLCDHCRCHRCVQANVNTHLLSLLCHQ